MMRKFKKILATGLGTGYLPVAPGTWGSALVAGLYLVLLATVCGGGLMISVIMAAVVLGSSILCVALGPFTEREFGKKDPGQCTIDEFAGQAIAFIALPMASGWTGWVIATAAGFFAFRAFDILKPPPARQMEKLPKGWGVLLDDLVAGIYANLTAQILLRWVIPALMGS